MTIFDDKLGFVRDDQWERMKAIIPGNDGTRGPRNDGRKFVDALIWVARSNGRWNDLPQYYGPVSSVRRRYRRWVQNGTITRIRAAFTSDPEIEQMMTQVFAELA